MTKFSVLMFSAACQLLVACGANEPLSRVGLQLKLGGVLTLKEQKTATLTPAISHAEGKLRFEWQQESGPPLELENEQGETLILTSPALEHDAIAILRLTVRDDSGSAVSAIQQIQLKANQPPSVILTDALLVEKTTATLTMTASDPDGQVVSVQWQQVAGPVVETSGLSATQLTLTLPAVTKRTTVKFAVTVVDDDGEAVVVQKQYAIEPFLQQFQLGGFLAAAEMGEAEIIASMGGQIFRSKADKFANYNLAVTLDDDEQNDFLTLRAISVTRPGMELWLFIPSVRTHPSNYATNITPFTTGNSALATRANGGVVPSNLVALKDAEQELNLTDAVLAGLIIAAFPELYELTLPQDYNSLFDSIVNADSFAALSTEMLDQHAELLAEVEHKLITQGWAKQPLLATEIQHGLRIETGGFDDIPGHRVFFQLNNDSSAQISEPFLSYSAQWGILNGDITMQADNGAIPELSFALNHPDLGLSAAQVSLLQNHAITHLQVQVVQRGEQLTPLSKGIVQSLFQRRQYSRYTIAPVTVGTEVLEFAEREIETQEYVWASALYFATLALSPDDIFGQWYMPMYSMFKQGNNSQFENRIVELNADYSGYDNQGTYFSWQLAQDIGGQTVLAISFNTGYVQVLRVIKGHGSGYGVDSFVYDNHGRWLSAISGTMLKR
ncbi:hypothetical protein ACFOEE_07370 [Pseudoalteromonas fenneropenaei]|uniref:Ig-like domain-containing protein n=1 Tax=Pseudoalteromonas fenneropenaei TaxID=1737459 RepID=A0ABV7CIJ4_9GAMM